MEEEEINYRVLRKIQKREQNSPKLSDIRYSFYKNVSDYLKNLEKRLKEETSSQKKKILKEEIENTKKIFLNIYEQREKKILLAAMSKARGGKPSITNMETIEKKLFDEIIEKINKMRDEISLKKNEKIKESKENKITKDKNQEKEPDKNLNNNSVIRIKNDVPEFIGTDKKKYNLKKNDILSTSPDICKILCKRGVSEKIEI